MLNAQAIYDTARRRCMHEMQTHFDASAFEQRMAEYIKDVSERYESEVFAQRFRAKCPLQGADLHDYNTQIIALPGGGFALSSLRFFALNPSRPFIMIEFSTDEINSTNVLAFVLQAKNRYGHLNINKYHFTTQDTLSAVGGLNLVRDKIWVKGLIAADRPARFDADDVVVCPMKLMTEDQYNIYKDELELFLLENEHLRGELNLEDPKYLAKLAVTGFLFEVRVQGNYAGFMAVDEGFEYACYGVGIIEEFLFKSHRGKRYGKVIQSKLIDNLIELGKEGSYLYGSIAHHNISSLKTAAHNLRRPFLYSWFADICA